MYSGLSDESNHPIHLISHVGEFVEGRKQWPQYVEWLKRFLATNGITDTNRKRDFFFGSGRAKCLQAVVQFGGATEAGGEDIY